MRFLAKFFLFIFALANLSTVALAAPPDDMPDDFINMSIQQRIDWIDENISPTYHQGTLISTTRNILRTYSGEVSSTADNALGQAMYRFTTGFEWTVNLDGTIESYHVTKQDFRRSNFAPPDMGYPNLSVSSYHVLPTNVKMYSQAEIAVLYNTGYTIGHDINLHSNGKYSFAPVCIPW